MYIFIITGVPRCPVGWNKLDNQCYYLAHDQEVSYTQAKTGCTNKGATLVTIHSQEEQSFLAGISTNL